MRSMFKTLSLLALLLLSGLSQAATLLVFGDSLSAGYGIPREQSWPVLLDQRLQREGRPYTVVNASISGETTAGGRARLAAALKQHRPAVLILELGANDGLRGLSLDAMADNLTAMARMGRAAGAKVLLVGMRLPPNYGPDYVSRFEATFPTLAKKEKTALLPFLLEPVAREPESFQADGMHPVAAAQPRLLDHLWPVLKPLL
ncbi:arylesterase [Denitratisoma sp. agr-D3]